MRSPLHRSPRRLALVVALAALAAWTVGSAQSSGTEMQAPTLTSALQPTVEHPPIPTPSGQPYWLTLTTAVPGPPPSVGRERRRIGPDYYQLALAHQAGQMTEHDRRTYDIRPNDRLELQLSPAPGRTDELAALITQEGGRVISNGIAGLLVEISIPTLLVLEQSPALGALSRVERPG